jgi:hypothetical protein
LLRMETSYFILKRPAQADGGGKKVSASKAAE